MNALEELKKYTKVVADTGDFESMKSFKPLDATTNPSLVLKAAKDSKYSYLIDDAIAAAKENYTTIEDQLSFALDKVAVNFGKAILDIVPGRVSTEVDARLSFSKEKTIQKAREIINLYAKEGVSKDKVLIKIASTWEGIEAATVLEKEGIHCNLTLLFSKIQAVACAEAGVQLISPFVGRIYDWYKKDRGVDSIVADQDPGVLSVKDIYNYYKKFGYQTEVMGASFRNIDEIIELAGCDLLTISPSLLAELELTDKSVIRKIESSSAESMQLDKEEVNEEIFRWEMNENPMATEKLAEGIRKFSADIVLLENMLTEKLKKKAVLGVEL